MYAPTGTRVIKTQQATLFQRHVTILTTEDGRCEKREKKMAKIMRRHQNITKSIIITMIILYNILLSRALTLM